MIGGPRGEGGATDGNLGAGRSAMRDRLQQIKVRRRREAKEINGKENVTVIYEVVIRPIGDSSCLITPVTNPGFCIPVALDQVPVSADGA